MRSSESEPPSRSELETEEREVRQSQMYHEFCVAQELEPESVEAAIRFEEWFEEWVEDQRQRTRW